MEQIEEILDVSTLAGKLMLESGGETARVEDTVRHLSCALGAMECEVFATPTAIVTTLTDAAGQVRSGVRRILQRTTRLDRVEAVNSLSREAASRAHSVEDVKAELRRIAALPVYPFWLTLLASGLGAGGFAVFFGGGLLAAVGACISGVLLHALLRALTQLQPNLFVNNIVGGAFATACGIACARLGLSAGPQEVTIAVLMLMVPGVAITNALRDIAAGDLLAGLARVAEAFCIAAALACGTALVYAVAQGLGV